MTAARRRTFTVSRARAFVGSALGDQLGNIPDDELEDLTRHMEDHFAAEEVSPDASTEEPEDLLSSEA